MRFCWYCLSSGTNRCKCTSAYFTPALRQYTDTDVIRIRRRIRNTIDSIV